LIIRDCIDGRLITGDDVQSGFQPGKTNYVIIYGEGCFKPRGRRNGPSISTTSIATTCILWSSTWAFDARPRSRNWLRRYYRGYIPHLVVLDADEKALYDGDGEVASRTIEDIFEQSWG